MRKLDTIQWFHAVRVCGLQYGYDGGIPSISLSAYSYSISPYVIKQKTTNKKL